VLEKRRLPRVKTCSGILYGQAQELLIKYFGRLPPREVRCDPEVVNANNAVEWKEDGSIVKYTWELPKDGHTFSEDWLNVWRAKFDFWMLTESGADYADQSIFAGYTKDGRRIRVSVRSDSGDVREYTCDYLVGADGAVSHVRRLVDPKGFKDAKKCVSDYAYYELQDLGRLKDAHWYVFLRKQFGEIIACVHRKDNMLALSVGGFAGIKFKEYEKNLVEFLQTEGGAVLGARQNGCGCAYYLAKPFLGDENVLLAGDAAGLIYLNGEGISSAIDSGYRAGRAIVDAMGRGASDAASIYGNNAEDVLRHMDKCMQQLSFVVPS
jgi:flavin-dependent dehydrogenase